MLTETFTLIIQLPPLAFGPMLPPPAFTPPRALVSPLLERSRLREPARSPQLAPLNATLDPRFLTPAPERYLVSRPVDLLLFLATAYAGRATWDSTPWSARTWQATGAVAPVLIPPLAPPAWSTSRP